MKILQVNCIYNKGSTGKIVHDIHVELQSRGIESVVCYGRGEKVKESNVYKTCGELYSKMNHLLTRFTGVMYGGCFFSTNNLISIIKSEKPDVVHLHCINGYFVNIYRLVAWLKKNHIKTLLTLHAEFMYTGGCAYTFECNKWLTGCIECPRNKEVTKSLVIDNTKMAFIKMQRAFNQFTSDLLVCSVSSWLKGKAAKSLIFSDVRHEVVLNGVDTSIFYYHDSTDIKKQLGFVEKKIVFHATAGFSVSPTHIKGGYYIVQLAKRMPEVIFVVAGSVIDVADVPPNLNLLGTVSDQQELARYYSMADVTVLVSKKETFSMPTAESLCCGTPVVGFMAGGPESICIDDYSKFSEYGNLDSLQHNIEECFEIDWDKKQISKKAIRKYSKSVMTDGYISLYKEIAEKYKGK